MNKTIRPLEIGCHSDIGRRQQNEDRALAFEDWPQATPALRDELGQLYIVADGVGGNDDGEIASQRVVEQLMQHYYLGQYPSALPAAQRLNRAIQSTTRAIYAEALARNSDMRSTLVAALLLDPPADGGARQLVVANVGDSPALLFRRGQPPRRLTRDDRLIDGCLTQTMGDPTVDAALISQLLLPTDLLLLCSDGLADGDLLPLGAVVMARVLASNSAPAAARKLIRLAKRAGSADNLTALVLRQRPRMTRLASALRFCIALALMLALGLGAYAAGTLGLEAPAWRSSIPAPTAEAPAGTILSGVPASSTARPTATIAPSPTIAKGRVGEDTLP